MIGIPQSIQELLRRDKNLQNKNFQSSVAEVFRICTNIECQILKEIFVLRIGPYSIYCIQETECTICLA